MKVYILTPANMKRLLTAGHDAWVCPICHHKLRMMQKVFRKCGGQGRPLRHFSCAKKVGLYP